MARVHQLGDRPDGIKIGDLIGDFRAANSVRALLRQPPMAISRLCARGCLCCGVPAAAQVTMGGMLMDMPSKKFALAGSLEELKIKGRLVVHGGHRPILVIYDRGRVFALDNRCPHMGFPLERGSVEDGILTSLSQCAAGAHPGRRRRAAR
ncbi:hypothetical protein CP49_25235 [Bradyrhizobium valentinum]|uniref:Rieske domain-containing protein n=2 Tax=Bradyrhizobium valentinum TaxID=1518501 RepID=A0A0R3LEZ0_9BRAD|nr:hypothetical protein CP49_25235 [Bradyrhizobium valentinum]